MVCRPDGGSNQNGSDIPSLDQTLTVKKIELNSKYKGRFTVAVSDPDADDMTKPKRGISFDNEDYTSFELRKKNGELVGNAGWCLVADCPIYENVTDDDKKHYRYVLDKDKDNDRDSGTSLLVAPADSYRAKITLSAEQGLEGALYTEVDVELENKNDNGIFSAGKAYTIYLTINSLSDIKSEVESGVWTNGGDINISPDDEYKDE